MTKRSMEEARLSKSLRHSVMGRDEMVLRYDDTKEVSGGVRFPGRDVLHAMVVCRKPNNSTQ
jgi:hypothetical protein